jgi:hypothetical protein
MRRVSESVSDTRLSVVETSSADVARLTDPAWLLRAHAPDLKVPRSLRPEPTLPSDRRIGNSAPTSLHHADPSSSGGRPSLEPVWF